ncbi:MAG: GIY-YIG nuclease family protein [Gammaproteobacteria bacterium]|nr:GIY-YIG nuclease family protein [Gammaproteobacteria bacterium]
MDDWCIYIVRCADKTLYTGITRDAGRRVEEHNGNNNLGARYTRARRPVKLVYQESAPTRSKASIRESEIKHLSKKEKEILIVDSQNRP